jgi:hypothetical protein
MNLKFILVPKKMTIRNEVVRRFEDGGESERKIDR